MASSTSINATKNLSEKALIQGSNGSRSRNNSNELNILADPLSIENEAIAWKWNSNQVWSIFRK